jgi:ribonuclease G
VLKTLRKQLDEDRTKTFVVEISPLGLVEMTRQNVTEGVREMMTRPCPTCDGEGVIRSEETIAIDVERRLRELVKERRDAPEAFLVQLNPGVTAEFTGNGSRMLRELEDQTGRRFLFEGSDGLPMDHFAVTYEGSREQVEERALPFRPGEEVLVQIVEPHMYKVDDAVAKIDGYIIEIAGGGSLVGEKRLVRIDEVGRTAARASLVDADGAVISPEASEDEKADGVQSRTRRRGRRGGRRRSRAKAGAAAEGGDSGSADE